MRGVIRGMIVVMIGALLGCVVATERPPSGPPPRSPGPPLPPSGASRCAPPHRLAILDLDMIPDPVDPRQPLAAWRITIQSDRNGECGTLFQVRDQDQIAGAGELPTIHPGRGVYTIPATPGYRFQRRDHCFVVVAELEQRYAPIASQGTFCARPSPGGGWTLRER